MKNLTIIILLYLLTSILVAYVNLSYKGKDQKHTKTRRGYRVPEAFDYHLFDVEEQIAKYMQSHYETLYNDANRGRVNKKQRYCTSSLNYTMTESNEDLTSSRICMRYNTKDVRTESTSQD